MAKDRKKEREKKGKIKRRVEGRNVSFLLRKPETGNASGMLLFWKRINAKRV